MSSGQGGREQMGSAEGVVRRPLRATLLLVVVAAVPSIAALLGLGFAVSPISLMVAAVFFGLGANARERASAPVRFLDGAAALVGGQVAALLAVGDWSALSSGALAIAAALGVGGWLQRYGDAPES